MDIKKFKEQLKKNKAFTEDDIIRNQLLYIKRLPNITTDKTQDQALSNHPVYDIESLFKAVIDELDVLGEMLKKTGQMGYEWETEEKDELRAQAFIVNSMQTSLSNLSKLKGIINENVKTVKNHSKNIAAVQEGVVDTVNLTRKKLDHIILTVMDECEQVINTINK